MRINLKEACSCQFYVDINAMAQMDVICFARWRELDLLGISFMLTYVLDTEISSQNKVVRIWINFVRRSN